MAKLKHPPDQEWSIADDGWGFQFGCDGVMTVDQAAGLLTLSIRSIHRLIKSGQIRSGHPMDGERVIRRTYICRRSVENFIAMAED